MNKLLQSLKLQASVFLSDYARNFAPGAKCTLIIRNPGFENADVIVTDDTFDNAITALEKLKAKDKPPLGVPSPYLVHCVKDENFGSCGASSYLTEEQYNQQLSDPNKGWRCPQCHCYPCNWDDAHNENHLTAEEAECPIPTTE